MLITILAVLLVINEARRRRKACAWDNRAASVKIGLGFLVAVGSEVLMRIGPAQPWSPVWIVGMVLQLTSIYAIARGVYRKIDLRKQPVLATSTPARSIPAATSNAQFNWSDCPGCFERHLQRRFNNLLFPADRRLVTEEDLRVARLQDQADAREFKAEVQNVLNHVSKLPATSTVHECLELRKRLDDMLDRAAAVGGTVTTEAVAILSLRESLMQTVRNSATRTGEDSVQGLDKAEQAQRKAAAISRNEFLAQMQRKDSPVTSSDVIPALLSESPETIRFALGVMGEHADIAAARRTAAQVLISAQAEGLDDPLFEQKLEAIGITAGVGAR